jgi:hypothetical protein
MNFATHMPDGERRKPIDIEVCRSKVKVTTYCSILEIVILTFNPQTSSS